MSIDKQIEELAKDLSGEIEYDTVEHYYSEDSRWTELKIDYTKTAENIINKGYRKASDVAREIFNRLENTATRERIEFENEIREKIKQEARERKAEWRRKNPESIRMSNAKYYEKRKNACKEVK
jgi:hypothetical protein